MKFTTYQGKLTSFEGFPSDLETLRRNSYKKEVEELKEKIKKLEEEKAILLQGVKMANQLVSNAQSIVHRLQQVK